MTLLIPILLAWDMPADVKAGDVVRVYRGIEVMAQTTASEVGISLPVGASTLSVAIVRDGVQGAMSAPLNVHIIAPSEAIQSSVDLESWHDLPQLEDVYFRLKPTQSAFFRISTTY